MKLVYFLKEHLKVLFSQLIGDEPEGAEQNEYIIPKE